MAKRKRPRDRPARGAKDAGTTPDGSGPLVGQVGLFETGSGFPHGPVAIVMAVAAAAILIPLTRLARSILRR